MEAIGGHIIHSPTSNPHPKRKVQIKAVVNTLYRGSVRAPAQMDSVDLNITLLPPPPSHPNGIVYFSENLWGSVTKLLYLPLDPSGLAGPA